jgi:hypothetical protein
VADELDLTPIEMDCIRCRERALMRFYGLCTSCRDELHAKFDGLGRTVEVAAYEPKMNVTPNAVALKDD